MTVIREWIHRLWGTFRKAPPDADMEEELRLHVDMIADELQRRGMPRDRAEREARLQAGGMAQAMERRRDRRGLPWLEDFIGDVRYAARTLRRNPGFTTVAVVTLTLAIGANTAIFSLVDPLLFRDLPVRDPAELVQFSFQYPRDPPLNVFSLASYEQYRDGNHVFSDVFGFVALSRPSRNGDEPIAAHLVTGNFFRALGVQPAMGRVITPSDDLPGSAPAAVVSWQYWKTRLNGDPRVVGSAIDVRDARLPAPMHATIVGISEPRFSGIAAGYYPDVWMSLSALPEQVLARASLSVVARLKPGVSIEQARAEMRVLDRARIEPLAQRDPQWLQAGIDVTPARTGLDTPLQQQFGGALLILMAMVLGVLLLACVNVGGLLLARGAARQHEMAVRVSLGAGRFRVFRQVLTESLLLAMVGSVPGLIAARLAATALLRIITSGTRTLAAAPQLTVPLDGRVLLFTIAVSVLSALVFGLAPALAAFSFAPAQVLRQGGAQPRARRAFGNALVVAQIAIALTLLSVAQLSIDHLRHLRDRSLGFDRDGMLLMSVDTSAPGRTREQLAALYASARARLQAIPGVRSIAASGMTPISGAAGSRFLRAEGFDEPAQARSRVFLNTISADYFATYGTPLIAGRDFRETDLPPLRIVIVNQALVRHYFAARDPIGRHVWLENDREPYEIVGVVGDAKYQDVRVAAPPTLYFHLPVSRGSTHISLRTSGRPMGVAGDARRLVNEVFGANSVQRVTTLAEQVDASIVPERLIAMLAGFFGAAGALLAAIGLYGLLAYTVARRTREIGIRVALGATRGDVIRMVLTGAAWLVGGGLLLGAPVAFWAEFAAATRLITVASVGAVSITVAIATLLMVALLAAYVPAHRATRIEPLTALRAE